MAGKRGSGSGQASKGQKEWVVPADRLALSKIVSAQIEFLHISRKELERRSGVSPATIREIERPRKPRTFGRAVLEALSVALEFTPDTLVRAYRSSPDAPDPMVQEMMTALAPYLQKIDAIPRLQKDVAEIKAGLGLRADIIYPVD